jgi:hypothetical protein
MLRNAEKNNVIDRHNVRLRYGVWKHRYHAIAKADLLIVSDAVIRLQTGRADSQVFDLVP